MDTSKMNTDQLFNTLPSYINDKGELYALHIFRGKRIIIEYRTDRDENGLRKVLADTHRSVENSLENALRSMLDWLIKFGYYDNHLIENRNEIISKIIDTDGTSSLDREELIADIRNKLNPLSGFIDMVENYMTGMKSYKDSELLKGFIKEQLPQAIESIEYIRKLE